MNFFEHQRLAKKYSQRMVIFFIATLVLLILATSIAVILVSRFSGLCQMPDAWLWGVGFCYFEGKVLTTSTICVVLLVLGGSLIKYGELRADTDAIAKAMGGRRVEPGSSDPLKRRLVNVVEEMAIASGVPVPSIYVIDGEMSLNAFAAGYDIHHSLVAVTEGLLKSINREELQAVIAHEFSHIVHGDMKLNRNLVVVVYGISMISMFGAGIVRTFSRARLVSTRRGKKGDATPHLILLGMAVFVIGYLGLLMSRILKASISRQREYLADASAVQYTRNPAGLSACFKKIIAHGNAQLMENKTHETYSHMFFANAFFSGRRPLFSTHPPLEDRIARLEPGFRYDRFIKEEAPRLARDMQQVQSLDESKTAKRQSRPAVPPIPGGRAILASIGSLNDSSIDRAVELRQGLPRRVELFCQDPSKAQYIIEALFLDQNAEIREKQLHEIGQGQAVRRRRLTQVFSLLGPLDIENRMVVCELALSTLKQYLSNPKDFLTELQGIIQSRDARCIQDFLRFEYIRQALMPAATSKEQLNLSQCENEVGILLELLVFLADGTEASFHKGLKTLGLSSSRAFSPRAIKSQDVRAALRVISNLRSDRDQERLLQVCLEIIHEDGVVNPMERELLRLLTALMGVPLPLCVAQ
jgi:Zn-dependent protease with chaperone function